MRWLLHGNVAPAVADALREHEQTPTLPADVELPPDAPPADVFELAKKRQLEIMTSDAALAGAPFDPDTRFARTIVFLQAEGGEVEQADAVDRLFQRYKRLSPGRLYTVTASRVKIRQLPGM